MPTSLIDPLVIEAVQAWALAPNLEAAGRALQEKRLSLAPVLLPQLCQEIAEISAEALVDLIALEKGLEEGEFTEVEGIPLLPKQLERVSAWHHDQLPTAQALGLTPERWGELLIGGMERLCGQLGTTSQDEAREESAQIAQKLLGGGSQRFENPPQPGQSKQAGLQGLLAAREFQKKGK